MDITAAFSNAFALIAGADPALAEIVQLSLAVTLTAVLCAMAVGLPVGAGLALARFPGREALVIFFNAMMGLPPVVAGLLIYLLLSRSGPLGSWGLLFTPTAMVVVQAFLITPIIASLTRQVVEDLWEEYSEQLRSLGCSRWRAVPTLLWDARFSLATALLAGFGRASAEVGAIMIVGGNINGYTRMMTTAIALETSKGDLPLALGLGIILIGLTLAINAAVFVTSRVALRVYG